MQKKSEEPMVLKIQGSPGFSPLSSMLGGRILLPWIGDGGGDGQASRKPTWASSPSSSESTKVVEVVVDSWVSSHLHWEGIQSS